MTTQNNALVHSRLQLNINVPELEHCWLEGYEASDVGSEEEHNPYSEGSCESEHWITGWWASFYGEEPLYDYEGNVKNMSEANIGVISPSQTVAANEAEWLSASTRQWAKRVAKVAGVIAASVAVYELVDLVV